MNNKMHPFFKILIVFFGIYVVLFILNETGYYEKSVRSRTTLTEQKRLEFEQDIEEGKVIDVISYLPEKQDYANILTKSANYLAKELGIIVDDRMEDIWHFLKALFIG
jgi:hypothetical protein